MTKTFDIDLYDGHLIINNNGQKILVDTGSPVTIGRSNVGLPEQQYFINGIKNTIV